MSAASKEPQSLYQCMYCKAMFTSLQMTSDHIHQAHQISIECELCGEKFRSKAGLTAHFNQTHAKGLIETKDQPAKRCQVPSSASEPQFHCTYCTLTFTSKKLLTSHNNQAHKSATKCDLCGEKYGSKRGLTSHIAQTHRKAVNESSHQSSTDRIQTKPDPDAKQSKPYRAIPSSCGICKEEFASKTVMRKHMWEKHNLRAEICKCRLCDKSYVGRCSLNHHMRIKHSTEKLYMCAFCGKSFQTGNQLSLHEANHAEKTIECDLCDKKFPSKSAWRSHKQSVHGPFKFIQCEICGKTFKTVDIASHKRAVHIEDSKKYVHECVICGKKYAGTSGLKFHMSKHENALRFECDICSKRFNTKCSIQSHILIHLDDRKHKCNLCDKAFVMQHMLRSHMATHTKEKRFACEVCGQRFRWKHDRDKHQNRKH